MINHLKEFRKRIDDIDVLLVELLEKRLNLTKEVADFKQKNNIQIEDHNREHEVTEHLAAIVSEENKVQLSENTIKNIWKCIFGMTKQKSYTFEQRLNDEIEQVSKLAREIDHQTIFVSEQLHNNTKYETLIEVRQWLTSY